MTFMPQMGGPPVFSKSGEEHPEPSMAVEHMLSATATVSVTLLGTKCVWIPSTEIATDGNNPTKRNCQESKVVIMLHGWAQNASVFQKRAAKWIRKLGAVGQSCLLIEAPHTLPPLPAISDQACEGEYVKQGRGDARAWFFYNEMKPSDRSKAQTGEILPYSGLDESLDLIAGILSLLPIEMQLTGLLGFSQGAVFAHIIASYIRRNRPSLDSIPSLSYASRQKAFSRVQKVVLVSGFVATPRGYTQEQLSGLAVPSLHFLGQKDTSVLPQLSKELVARFERATVYCHEKGHVLPSQSSPSTCLTEFLSRSLD